MKRRPWTEDELSYLREHYANHPSAEIAAALNRTLLSVYQGADKLGLRKSKEFLRASVGFQKGSTIGAEYRYAKGNVPVNKGTRRPGWAPGRMRETQFRKGDRTGAAARNWRPIGTILADHEGYLRIKVREAVHGQEYTGFGNTKVWPLLHRHIWEQAHGPIPPKHIVVFIDGNRANCVLENLELISMADNARRNSMWTKLPRDLAEVINLTGQLKRKLREKQANG